MEYLLEMIVPMKGEPVQAKDTHEALEIGRAWLVDIAPAGYTVTLVATNVHEDDDSDSEEIVINPAEH